MARLINDSGVMGETMVVTAENLNEVSFAKIIEAIHVMQSEMGLAGSTAEEVEGTIQGSFNAWKAAGSNLLVSIASGDKQGMQEATTAFTERTKILLGNLKPVVSNVVTSIGTLLTELLPDITSEALDFGSEIIANIVNGITGSSITSADVKATLEKLLDVGETALGNTLSFIKDALTWINENQTVVVTAIGAIAAAFLTFKLYTDPIGTTLSLISAGLVLLIANWNDVKAAIEGAVEQLRIFLGLSPKAGEGQKEYVAHATANAPQTAIQKYGGKYKDWSWDEKSAGQDYIYFRYNNDAEGKAEAEAALRLTLDEEAIETFKAEVEELVAEEEYSLDIEEAMFDPSVAASLQSQLDAMTLVAKVKVGTLAGALAGIGGLGYNIDGSHASGLNYVPKDNYLANLHLGEAVLPRHEADAWRSGGGSDNSGLINAINALSDRVAGIMQQVAANTAAGHSISLDGGALVGQLAPRLDAQLGIMTARKERRG